MRKKSYLRYALAKRDIKGTPDGSLLMLLFTFDLTIKFFVILTFLQFLRFQILHTDSQVRQKKTE